MGARRRARDRVRMNAGILRDAAALAAHGLLPPEGVDAIAAVSRRYAVAVTPDVARLIDRRDGADPIAKQFVPDARELVTTPDERSDPIGDDAHSPCEGIVHRYPDRVLLKLVNVCAVYCRFCFRRETVGQGGVAALSPQALARALAYVSDIPAIWEVILTGGDPLAAAPRRLAEACAGLAAIAHVKILRVHTRLPVVAPARIAAPILDALKASKKTVYIAIHANHPRELTAHARAACARLADAGFVLVSQSVLLRGVNDDASTLAALMRGFVEARIKPYYLHHPDLASGTSHFRLTIAEGQALVRSMRGRLSGLCQPAYVLDIPGGYGKSPIGPGYLDDDLTRVRDYTGTSHAYPP